MDNMNTNQKRMDILELCSESEYGSWEFWNQDNKSEEEGKQIIDAIVALVKEKKIISTDGRHVKNRSYEEIPLDITRLENEVRRSMQPSNVDPDTFYWFFATKEGKKEDLLLRRNGNGHN